MDFVWPYFKDAAHGAELELSLRSVQKNFQGNANLIVIGDLPTEINFDFTFVHCPRIASKQHHAFYDTFHKVHSAIQSDQVDEQFVWIHDDVFFIGEVTAETLQAGMYAEYKSLSDLLDYQPANNWLLQKKKTMLHLYDSGHRHVMDFDTHAPLLLDSQHVLQISDEFDIANNALLWQSVYGNTFEGMNWKPVSTTNAGFVRMTRPMSHFQISQRCNGASILNFTNSAWNDDAETAVRQLIHETSENTNEIKTETQRFPCMGDYRQSTNEVRKHGTCGSRGLIEQVYHCTKYDTKVTINQYNSYQPEKVCKKCELLNWQPNPVQEYQMEYPLKNFAAIIPYSDRGGRRKGFEYVKKWASEKFEIVRTPEQPADQVFNKSKLINQAVADLPDDTFVVLLDADSVVMDEALAKAVESLRKAPKSIVKPFTEAMYLNRDNSESVFADGHEGKKFDQKKRAYRSDGGLTLLSKLQYDSIGGHDERYTEWGWEDTQFMGQARNEGIDVIYIDGLMLHLWHPRNPNRNLGNKRLYRQWLRPDSERSHIPPSETSRTVATYGLSNVRPIHKFLRTFNEQGVLKNVALRSVAQLKRGMPALLMPTPVGPNERAFFKRANALRIPLFIVDNGIFSSDSFLFTDASNLMVDLFYHGACLPVCQADFNERLQELADGLIGKDRVLKEYAEQGSVIAVCDFDDLDRLKLNVTAYADLVEAMFPNDLCEFYFPDDSKIKTLNGRKICYVSDFYDACNSSKYVVAGSSNYLYKAELAGTNAFPIALHPFLNRNRNEKRRILFQLISQTIEGSAPFQEIISQLAQKTTDKEFWHSLVDTVD